LACWRSACGASTTDILERAERIIADALDGDDWALQVLRAAAIETAHIYEPQWDREGVRGFDVRLMVSVEHHPSATVLLCRDGEHHGREYDDPRYPERLRVTRADGTAFPVV
jgi:hypothetical protein